MFGTYKDILSLRSYIVNQSPQSSAYFDLHRATDARKGVDHWRKGLPVSQKEEKSYFAHVPYPYNSDELSEEAYTRLLREYGDSISKISIVDKNLLEWTKNAPTKDRILATGGACALESLDTKIIQFLQQQPYATKNIKQYVEDVISTFPTWTQITGALVPASPVSIFYDETFPWHKRIAEYGILDAEEVTQRLYDRIFESVERYAKLYNPQNIVLKVPFVDLNLLKTGKFDEWFARTEIYKENLVRRFNLTKQAFDESNYMKAWVEYTYNGPDILAVTKSVVQNKYNKIFQEYSLQDATIHVRGKQVDHLDSERMNVWMHAVILGNDNRKIIVERKDSLLTPHHLQAISIYEWYRDNYDKYRDIGFVGFLDHIFKGNISHESVDVPRNILREAAKKRSFTDIIQTPLRLHNGNVQEVFKLLEYFKSPHIVSFSKELLVSFVEMKDAIGKKKKKITKLQLFMDSMKAINNLILGMGQFGSSDDLLTSSKIESKGLGLIRLRYKADWFINKYIAKYKINQSSDDLIEKALKYVTSKDTFINDETSHFLKFFAKRLSEDRKIYAKDLGNLQVEIATLQELHKELLTLVSSKISRHQHSNKYLKYIDILPLGKNLFVSYMLQFLFVPIIRDALIEIVEIDKNKKLPVDEKEHGIINIISQIAPHLEEIILYVMKGGEYPQKTLFEAQYASSI